MKHTRLAAAAIGLALLGAAATDYFTGSIGVVSSAGMIGTPDRSGFKGTDEELQAVTAPDRDGGRAGRVTTKMGGNPDGVSTVGSSSPQSVSTSMGGPPDG